MDETIRDMLREPENEAGIELEEGTLYYYHMREEFDRYQGRGVSSKVLRDYMEVLTAIQGIVNREGPRIYFDYVRNTFDICFLEFYNGMFKPYPDKFWFAELRKEGEFLHGYKVVPIRSGATLVRLFGKWIKGAVVWDEEVCATSNVASTIAGVEDLVPLRGGGEVYRYYVTETGTFEVKRDLVGKFTGEGMIPDTEIPTTESRKCDAYLWAKAMYMDKGLTHPTILSNLVDAYPWKNLSATEYYPDLENTCVVNKDYYIANKVFFVDLNVNPHTAASDEPGQRPGTDFETLSKILRKQNELAGGRVCTYGGFVPWWCKYTDAVDKSLPDALAIEMYSAQAFAPYFMISDAEAYKAMANSSVYMHSRIATPLRQNTKACDRKLEPKNYIMLYMGDFDSAAWTNALIPMFYNDDARREMPFSWGVNSALADRIPHVFNYMYKNKSDKDYFVMGNSGAGHMATEYITRSERPEGLLGDVEDWIAYNREKAAQFDLDIGGFFIHDGHDIENTMQVYAQIAPGGAACSYQMGTHLIHGVPITASKSAAGTNVDIDYTANFIEDCCEFGAGYGAGRPTFNSFRCVWTSPTDLKAAIDKIQARHPDGAVEVVDPYTFFYLLKKYLTEGYNPFEGKAE